MPRSNADGKYHLFITLFNRTEMVFSYMPNTRYSGKSFIVLKIYILKFII